MSDPIPAILDVEHRRCLVGGEPAIFHCHHYNTFLQRSILDAEDIESRPVLIGAAAEVAYAQLREIFAGQELSEVSARAALASELYRWAGFGVLDLAGLSAEGGTISSEFSHYSLGWKTKFGESGAPVAFFDQGWLAGALAAIHDLPLGAYSVTQSACMATGAERNVYTLARGAANYELFTSVGAGTLSQHVPQPVPANSVDYEGILAAVSQLPLIGNAEGSIPAFGVYLTRHYANYYNRISFEFERRLSAKFGEAGREVAEPLLVEAGHVCAFHTFGGIMTSTEWDALIRPTLKTREDWVHGIVAVVNCLGWGRWQVVEVSEEAAEFVIHDDYESVGYRAMYGESDHDVSYLHRGGVAGAMNLVYLGDIANRPALTGDYYQSLFRGEGAYSAECLESQARGHAVTRFRVTRAK